MLGARKSLRCDGPVRALLFLICLGLPVAVEAQNTDVWAPQNNPAFDHSQPSLYWNTTLANWTVNGTTQQTFRSGDNVYFDDQTDPGWSATTPSAPPYSPPTAFIPATVSPGSITVVAHNVGTDFILSDYNSGAPIADYNPATPTTLTKLGPGGLIFLNGDSSGNTFTGATTVYQGTLSLYLGEGSVTYSQPGDATDFFYPIHNDTFGLLSSLSPLVMAGGRLEVLGLGLENNFGWQTFNNAVIASGSSSIDDRTNSDFEGTSINLGPVTRSVGGVADFEIAPEINGFTATNAITTSNANINGILGGWATYGTTEWASVNNGNILPLSGNGGYTADAWAAANNTNVTANDAIAANSTTNSLRFNTANSNTVTLSGANVISTGGILVTPNVGANNVAIAGGTLTSANGQDLIVVQNDPQGTMTISSQITDNGSSVGLTVAGAGLVTATASNTYSGITTIDGGYTGYQVVGTSPSQSVNAPSVTTSTLSVAILSNGGSPSGIGSSSNAAANLVINGGTLQYTGTGATIDRLFTIGVNGAGIDASGSGTLDFANTSSLAVSQNTNVTLTLTGTNTGNNEFDAVIPDPTPANANAPAYPLSLIKNGPGTWLLTAANTYSGGTTINSGSLIVQNTTGSGTGSGNVDVYTNSSLTNNGSIVSNTSGTLVFFIPVSGVSTSTGVNNGVINCTGTGEALSLGGGASFTNNGIISASAANASDVLAVDTSTFINNATGIVSGPDSTYSFEDDATIVNNGKIASPFLGLDGTISGTGTFSGAYSYFIQATLQPGDGSSSGTLTFDNSLEIDEASDLAFILDKPDLFGAPGQNDLISVPSGDAGDGTLILHDYLSVSITAGPDFAPGTYELIDYAGTLNDQSSDFSNWNAAVTNADDNLSYYFYLDTTDRQLDLVITAVPEPACGALIMGTLTILATRRRRIAIQTIC